MSTLRVGAVLLLSGALAACGGSGSNSADATGIAVDGSSTVYPISEAIAEEFVASHRDIRVTVGFSGTGGGFQKFCRGETVISNASRPIRPAEIEACRKAGIEYIELPVAYDGIAIVVHPNNTWASTITVDELKTIWAPEAQGKILRWNQIRSSWPDREIRLFGAGVDSGTYDYFTDAIVGEEGASRGDFTSSEDDNVLVQGISGDEAALGFLPLAYFEENSSVLKALPVDDGNAENGTAPVMPSFETVRTGTYQPLSRPLFIYVSRQAADRPEVQQFVDLYFTSPDLIREVGYVPLTPQLYELAARHFTERRVGSAFASGGSQVGMTLEELLAREQ